MDEKDLQEILSRINVQGRGYKSDDATVLGGRIGYTHPIDESSEVEVGATGHYAKGKGWKDTNIDRGDVTYRKKFKNDSELRASIGGGAKGIDEGRIEYEIPFKKGGKVSKASKRGDGIAQRGKTKGRLV